MPKLAQNPCFSRAPPPCRARNSSTWVKQITRFRKAHQCCIFHGCRRSFLPSTFLKYWNNQKIRHSMIDHLITSQEKHMFFSLSIKYLPPPKKKAEQQKNGVIQAAAPAAPHGVANDPAPQCRHWRRSSRPLAMPGDLARFHQRNSGRKTQHFDNDNEAWINDHE